MDNFEDQHIDDLFREGSDQHDFPFKESSWDKMESLIEADKKEKKKPVMWFTLLGLLLISITSIGIYLYTNNEAEIKTTPIETSQEINQNIAENLNPDKEKTNNTQIQNSNTGASKNIESKEIFISSEKIESVVNVGKEEAENKFTNIINNSNSKKKAIGLQNNYVIQRDVQNKKAVINQEATPIAADIAKMEKSSGKIFAASKLDMLPIYLRPNDKPFEAKSKSFPFEKKKSQHFGIALVAGREYSSVGLLDKKMGGHRIGLELNYQFNKKFEISAGAIISKKKYITEAQNYSFSNGMMEDIKPEMVHGSCDVTEIPVEFSYFFKSYDQAGFYLTAGASTFLMRKEWYDFEYDKIHDQDPTLQRYWSDEGINNHLFGVGTLSIGYQKPINNIFTLQVEPYFQIPFTGIGTGQVDLVSAGLQLKLLLKK